MVELEVAVLAGVNFEHVPAGLPRRLAAIQHA